MAALPGFLYQQKQLPLFDASGTVTTGGTPQLVLAVSQSRSYLVIENLDATTNLYFEFGSARATATLTSGVVTSCTVTNGGFGFTYPPSVTFMGGGTGSNAEQIGVGQPGWPAPGLSEGGGLPSPAGAHPATARAILSGGAVASIVIDDGGSGYSAAPYVFIKNSPLDPIGCANPFSGAVATGILLLPGGSQTYESSICTTDQISVFSSLTGHRFTCKYMP